MRLWALAFAIVNGLPPICTPTPPVPFAIVYVGLTSGCTQSNIRPCLAGETVQLSVGNHSIDCPPTEYVWQIPGYSGPGPWTLPHVFSSAGSFLIEVKLFNANGTATITTTINVAPASAIPTLSPAIAVCLALFLLVAASRRL